MSEIDWALAHFYHREFLWECVHCRRELVDELELRVQHRVVDE